MILSATVSFAAKITTTEQLIEAMQKKYAKSWYRTATFVQKTTNIDKDGNRKVETWYEAMFLPGSLRIDFTPTKDGNGSFSLILRSTFSKMERSTPAVHMFIP